jgi:hypothetical protein
VFRRPLAGDDAPSGSLVVIGIDIIRCYTCRVRQLVEISTTCAGCLHV